MNFLNPWFFAGAAAAAVPILLHLIRRERARKIEFPTLMYLRRISKKTIRFQKLRHLLLLLLRVAALILLTLAFTRPFREAKRAAAAPARQTRAHVILLDNSLSMAYGDRWQSARKKASEIVRGAQSGDKVALVEFSDVVTVRSTATSETAGVLTQIEGAELSDRLTRYGQALRAAERIALDAGTDRRVLHMISDFQKSGWSAEEHDVRLDASIEIAPVDVGAASYSNLAFGEVRIRELDGGPEPAAAGAAQASGTPAAKTVSDGTGLRIDASVVNFGTEDRKSVAVALSLDGRRIQETRIDLPRGAVHPIQFDLPGLVGGVHAVILELEDGNLARDNRYYMAVESRGKTPVVSVETAGSGRGKPASFFLSHALNISALSPYRLAVAPPQRLEAADALAGSIVVWNNVASAPSGAAQAIERHVREGGGLVVALGEATRPTEFQRMFGWVPVRIEEGAQPVARRPATDYRLLTDVRIDHPIFKPFQEPHSGTFSSARFFGHQRLRVAPGGEVLARFDNGDPALVAAAVDRGNVLIWASSADDSWNDLPVRAIYAPFWQQMLRYLDRNKERRRSIEVGGTIAPEKLLAEAALRQGKGAFDMNQAVVVLDPAKKRVPAASGTGSVVASSAGFYEVRSSALGAFVPVNTVARESDLQPASAEELAAGWTSHDAAAQASAVTDEGLPVEEQERRSGFWRFLLAAVLLFFVTEGLLANQLVLKPE